jgi:hypothetical protein
VRGEDVVDLTAIQAVAGSTSDQAVYVALEDGNASVLGCPELASLPGVGARSNETERFSGIARYPKLDSAPPATSSETLCAVRTSLT